MIKLFVTDLDGCISYPFKTPRWDSINKIRELNIASRQDNHVPPLTICTGRPYPYAEAVAQWLDVRLPFVFESAGLFITEEYRVHSALGQNNGILDSIKEMRTWMEESVIPKFPSAMIEFTKRMDAGIVATDKDVIDAIIPVVKEKMETDYPHLEMHVTDVSVNVLVGGNNKLQGMKLLAEHLNITLDEIAYIGDTGGDLVALKEVKMPFAPKNATAAVRKNSITINSETTDAVLEAYEQVVKYNRSL
ncbi:MAG: HAD family phosphatase [Balneolaceae bacterium]|nr:MAG: HAD family phosphatase [Balneolaceae bacterium]